MITFTFTSPLCLSVYVARVGLGAAFPWTGFAVSHSDEDCRDQRILGGRRARKSQERWSGRDPSTAAAAPGKPFLTIICIFSAPLLESCLSRSFWVSCCCWMENCRQPEDFVILELLDCQEVSPLHRAGVGLGDLALVPVYLADFGNAGQFLYMRVSKCFYSNLNYRDRVRGYKVISEDGGHDISPVTHSHLSKRLR